jgi:hypothetical protein
MPMRLVQLWSARAQHAVLRRISSNTLPRRAAYFSNATTRGYHSWLTPWPRWAVWVLLKTRNKLQPQFSGSCLQVHDPASCREFSTATGGKLADAPP